MFSITIILYITNLLIIFISFRTSYSYIVNFILNLFSICFLWMIRCKKKREKKIYNNNESQNDFFFLYGKNKWIPPREIKRAFIIIILRAIHIHMKKFFRLKFSILFILFIKIKHWKFLRMWFMRIGFVIILFSF